jgi:hypothetical protein
MLIDVKNNSNMRDMRVLDLRENNNTTLYALDVLSFVGSRHSLSLLLYVNGGMVYKEVVIILSDQNSISTDIFYKIIY